MKRAFIVCGPEYSGNRLVAGLLVSAGCWGRGSDDQPTREEDNVKHAEKVVVIAHLKNDICAWHQHFVEHDYEVHFVLTARDPWVQVRSRSAAAGCRFEDSMVRYRSDYRDAFTAILATECGFTVMTYESLLWKGAAERFLSLFDMKQTHPLVVQGVGTTIRDENGKWYA